jgi:hypothetical protein
MSHVQVRETMSANHKTRNHQHLFLLFFALLGTLILSNSLFKSVLAQSGVSPIPCVSATSGTNPPPTFLPPTMTLTGPTKIASLTRTPQSVILCATITKTMTPSQTATGLNSTLIRPLSTSQPNNTEHPLIVPTNDPQDGLVVNSSTIPDPSALPASGICTLVDAINAINTQSQVGGCNGTTGFTKIYLPTSTYLLNTVNNTVPDYDPDGGANGLPVITGNPSTGNQMTIEGNGSGIINGPAVRVFDVAKDTTFTIHNLSIQGYLQGWEQGAGLYNAGSFFASGSTLRGESASQGGALFNAPNATMTLDSSTIWYSAAYYGGAIANEGSLTINNSLIEGNGASTSGDGIYNSGIGSVNIQNSSFQSFMRPQNSALVNISTGSVTINNTCLLTSDPSREVLSNPTPTDTVQTPQPSNINAIGNWWGSADGPGPVGSGGGSRVGAGITYYGWLSQWLPICAPASATPTTTLIASLTPTNTYIPSVTPFRSPTPTSTPTNTPTINPSLTSTPTINPSQVYYVTCDSMALKLTTVWHSQDLLPIASVPGFQTDFPTQKNPEAGFPYNDIGLLLEGTQVVSLGSSVVGNAMWFHVQVYGNIINANNTIIPGASHNGWILDTWNGIPFLNPQSPNSSCRQLTPSPIASPTPVTIGQQLCDSLESQIRQWQTTMAGQLLPFVYPQELGTNQHLTYNQNYARRHSPALPPEVALPPLLTYADNPNVNVVACWYQDSSGDIITRFASSDAATQFLNYALYYSSGDSSKQSNNWCFPGENIFNYGSNERSDRANFKAGNNIPPLLYDCNGVHAFSNDDPCGTMIASVYFAMGDFNLGYWFLNLIDNNTHTPRFFDSTVWYTANPDYMHLLDGSASGPFIRQYNKLSILFLDSNDKPYQTATNQWTGIKSTLTDPHHRYYDIKPGDLAFTFTSSPPDLPPGVAISYPHVQLVIGWGPRDPKVWNGLNLYAHAPIGVGTLDPTNNPDFVPYVVDRGLIDPKLGPLDTNLARGPRTYWCNGCGTVGYKAQGYEFWVATAPETGKQ